MNLLFGAVRDAGLLTLVACWLGSSLGVTRDARQRFRGDRVPPLLGLASLTFPLAAPLFYLCLRPDTLLERRERQLVRRCLEQVEAPGERCLVCLTQLERDFVCCPGCGLELTTPCGGCSAAA